MGSEDKCLSMVMMFMEESRRCDEEIRRQDEERFLWLIQSIQPQAAPAVEGKSDSLSGLMREIMQFSLSYEEEVLEDILGLQEED